MTFARARTEWLERKAAERAAREAHPMAPARVLRPGVYAPVAEVPQAAPKDAPYRSEKLRRLVAMLPCINCGKQGPNQCAHANYGKGMGMKASDLDTFSLCPDCHRRHDQGGELTKTARRQIEQRWVEETRAHLSEEGLWPKPTDNQQEKA